MSKRLEVGSSVAKTKPLHGIQAGSPMVVTLGQHDSSIMSGQENPTVSLYCTLAGTPDKNKNKTNIIVVPGTYYVIKNRLIILRSYWYTIIVPSTLVQKVVVIIYPTF